MTTLKGGPVTMTLDVEGGGDRSFTIADAAHELLSMECITAPPGSVVVVKLRNPTDREIALVTDALKQVAAPALKWILLPEDAFVGVVSAQEPE